MEGEAFDGGGMMSLRHIEISHPVCDERELFC